MNNNIIALCASAAIAGVTLFGVPNHEEKRLEFVYRPYQHTITFTGTQEQLTELLHEWHAIENPGWMFDVQRSRESARVLEQVREKGALYFLVDTLERQHQVQEAYRRVMSR